MGPGAKSSRLAVRCLGALGRIAQASRQSWDSAARAAAPAAEDGQGQGLDLEDMVDLAAEGSEVEAVAAAQAVVRATWVAARRTQGMPRTTGWCTPSGRRSRAPFCTEGCTRLWDVSHPADPSSTNGTSRRRGSARCTGRHSRAGTACPCRRRTVPTQHILRLEYACTCARKGGTQAVLGLRGRRERARSARRGGGGVKMNGRAIILGYISVSHSRYYFRSARAPNHNTY